MPIVLGTRLGPYEVVAPIGAGGMGEVYRARDNTLGRDVALKVLSPALAGDADYMARFQREAQVLASLNHPHIAILHGLHDRDGVRALVMELVEGPTLAERIALGPIPLDEALPIARQIADALETAHERGIVHRDLKPANVKFTAAGAVKVLDFGLAKALDDEASPGTGVNSPTITMGATRAGVILGTAAYMPPEQAKGKRVDRRADIWAFGVVMFEMLTGRRMYDEETAPETLASVMRDEPRWAALPENTPPAVRTLLRRCLDKDPKRRLRDIGEARIALDEMSSGAAVITTAMPPQRKPAARLPWALFAIAALAAVAVSLIHLREEPPAERVLRYTIAPPPKSSIQNFALSPDGRYLALNAVTEGKRQLWVRPLDSLQPQLLPGTDDVLSPFWSPDSRYIAFFAQGKLKKIAVAGGPAQALCDAPEGRGGTWNRDGVIVFTPNVSNSVLQQVQAAGGVPSAVITDPDAALRRYPVFLPDGKRLLYFALSSRENTGVYVASLGGPAGKRLLADTSNAVYAQPQAGSKVGHLLFARESTLMAQPVHSDSLDPAGEVFPVADQIVWTSLTAPVPISVSNDGMLAYRVGSIAGESQFVWFDRTGKEIAKVGPPVNASGFALSRDEKTLAVARQETTVRRVDIWLHDSRGIDTRLTAHPSVNMQPVWSPDGRKLAFTSSRRGMFGLYLKETSGSSPDELFLQGGRSRFPTDWSHDGRRLLYVDTDPKNKWDLWTAPMDGERKPAPFLQTEFNECQGQFSPDGNWVAYASDESGPYEIYVRPFPPAPGKWKVSNSGGQFPRWRRDGKEIFYLDSAQKLTAVSVKNANRQAAAFEGDIPQALFDTHVVPVNPGFNNFQYAAGADGKRFLINTIAREGMEAPVVVVTNWLAAVKK
jgi:eukaryotic-like serine/threonine-protein kinase